MATDSVQNARRRLPILQGVLPLDRAQIPLDIVAGITLAALAIPEVMGYTQIAGMPVITGLYTILVPMALFAIFGSSRHLVVGADSATAAILAAGLAGMAATASSEYVALAGLLALMAAAFLLLARLIGLGFLADFLSRTVLIGFLTGVGIQVAIGQIAGMLGITGGSGGPIPTLIGDLQQLPQTNIYTLVISLAVLGIILGARRINKKIPGALIAVVGAILASYFFDLQSYGVAVLGPVPGGLPSISLPDVSVNWNLIQQLLPTAFSIFVVILAQSAATSRAYAARYGEKFSENVDLVGLGLANIGAGLTGTFVVNGSPTKTQMVDSAGGKSQLAKLTTAVIVIIVLLFLTVPLSYMPSAVLSSVVFLIGVELVDIKGMRTIFAQRPAEFWVALITALVVIFVGVEQGILLAIVLSLLLHTRHGYRPTNIVLAEENGHLRVHRASDPVEALPGLVLYRFSHDMYYANAELLGEELLRLQKTGPDPVQWLCVDMAAVDDVDFSAAATIRESCKELHDKGVQLVFCEVTDHVRAELDVSGITELVGEDSYFPRLEDVIAAYKQKTESGG
ncbi:MAG: SulP family inorganic anion transporter [Candidatus Promineifilaceae bacterium]|nr:SulP family inorganic anion transporter [Candidatus Promineifilaceae bacterium]